MHSFAKGRAAVMQGSPPVMLALHVFGALVMVSLRPATTKPQLATGKTLSVHAHWDANAERELWHCLEG